jgi:hypothetical protein
MDRIRKNGPAGIVAAVAICLGCGFFVRLSTSIARGQETNANAAPLPAENAALPSGTAQRLNGEALQDHLRAQIVLLDSPDFRVRELAYWRIEQYPAAAIAEIAQTAPSATVNAAALQVDLLDGFSNHPDSAISAAAYDVLKQLSLAKGTSLASLAGKSIGAIEGVNELKAFEILTHAGANIGNLNLSINGSQSEMFSANFLSIEIKSANFNGDSQALTWIRYLKSLEVVSLEGAVVTPQLLALVAQMPGVKKILLRSARITPDDLLVLKRLPEIQHLELNYMPITDQFIPALCQLPLSQSLRLFGTDLTADGKAELAQRLDGLEIYRGEGGFLGIASPPTGEVIVTRVVPGSAAAEAGIQLNDIISDIQGVPIKNFGELRENLAKFAPDENIRVKVRRPVLDPATGKRMRKEIELTVVLGEL